MPDPAWFPTQAELERKVGGAGKLVELSGAADMGEPAFATFVISCLAVGRGAVRKAVNKKHEPETIDLLDTETTISIRRAAVVKAAEAAWEDGTGDQAMPELLAEQVLKQTLYLTAVGNGDELLGRAAGEPAPALAQFAGTVSNDPQGTGMSLQGLRYAGFR